MKIGGQGEPPEFIRPDSLQVRPGDTLESLARSFGVDAAALARENNLPSGGELKAGMELVLPRQAAAMPDRGWVQAAGEALENAPFSQSEVIEQSPPDLADLVDPSHAHLLAETPPLGSSGRQSERHSWDIKAEKLAPALDENIVAEKLAPALDENIAAEGRVASLAEEAARAPNGGQKASKA